MKSIEQQKQTVVTVMNRVGKVKTAFTMSSVLYCGVHWITSHNFSVYALSAALLFGGLAAAAVAGVPRWYSRS